MSEKNDMNEVHKDVSEGNLTVSVVIPAHNCEYSVIASVNSVLKQTYRDFEIILIDDCSTDDTYKLLKSFSNQDNRIRVFQNEHNLGPAGTRNYGVRLAKGKWIAFLDSDDLWKKEKLEKQLTLANSVKEAKLLFTGSAFIEADGNPIPYILHVPETIDRKSLLKQNLISCSSVLVDRKLMLKYPMPDVNGIHEDFATWLRILKAVPLAYGVDEPLLVYRRAVTSKSGKKSKSALMNWRTYEYVGIKGFYKVYNMFFYTINGLRKNIKIKLSARK